MTIEIRGLGLDGAGVAADLSKALIVAATECVAEEQRIKQELLRRAQSGDAAGAMRLVSRWLDRPVMEVLGESGD